MIRVATIAILLALGACASPNAIRESTRDQRIARDEIAAEIKATEPRCADDGECASLWSAAKQWALHRKDQTAYHGDSSRITIFCGGDFWIELRLVPDGSQRVLRATRTCVVPGSCYNASTAAVLELNDSVNRLTADAPDH